jgi:hypothetical protein
VCIHLGRLFPKEGERSIQTEDLIELRTAPDTCLDLVVAFIEANEAKTRLPMRRINTRRISMPTSSSVTRGTVPRGHRFSFDAHGRSGLPSQAVFNS